MSMIIDAQRQWLMKKILSSVSQEEVKHIIDTVMRELDDQKINGYSIALFVDKMTVELEQLNPMDKTVDEWASIKTARMYFNQIRRRLETEPFHKN